MTSILDRLSKKLIPPLVQLVREYLEKPRYEFESYTKHMLGKKAYSISDRYYYKYGIKFSVASPSDNDRHWFRIHSTICNIGEEHITSPGYYVNNYIPAVYYVVSRC